MVPQPFGAVSLLAGCGLSHWVVKGCNGGGDAVGVVVETDSVVLISFSADAAANGFVS